VWETLFEWCADLFGVTVRNRIGQLVVYCVGAFVVGLSFSMRWPIGGWLVAAGLVLLPVFAAWQVTEARGDLWRAASLALDAPGQPPPERVGIVAPTAASLLRLASAVDFVRRGRYVDANELVPLVHRDLLRPEEVQLLDAVRAMISMGIGSTRRAAQQAVAALPTGSDELDVCLGRTVVAEAWNDPARLAAIHDAWDRAGAEEGPLARLTTLVRIRLDAEEMEKVSGPEARALSDEARAVGADDLAADLDARSRSNAYR
jgi:hypothetical protein